MLLSTKATKLLETYAESLLQAPSTQKILICDVLDPLALPLIHAGFVNAAIVKNADPDRFQVSASQIEPETLACLRGTLAGASGFPNRPIQDTSYLKTEPCILDPFSWKNITEALSPHRFKSVEIKGNLGTNNRSIEEAYESTAKLCPKQFSNCRDSHVYVSAVNTPMSAIRSRMGVADSIALLGQHVRRKPKGYDGMTYFTTTSAKVRTITSPTNSMFVIKGDIGLNTADLLLHASSACTRYSGLVNQFKENNRIIEVKPGSTLILGDNAFAAASLEPVVFDEETTTDRSQENEEAAQQPSIFFFSELHV